VSDVEEKKTNEARGTRHIITLVFFPGILFRNFCRIQSESPGISPTPACRRPITMARHLRKPTFSGTRSGYVANVAGRYIIGPAVSLENPLFYAALWSLFKGTALAGLRRSFIGFSQTGSSPIFKIRSLTPSALGSCFAPEVLAYSTTARVLRSLCREIYALSESLVLAAE
jgi:hypothetical protein